MSSPTSAGAKQGHGRKAKGALTLGDRSASNLKIFASAVGGGKPLQVGCPHYCFVANPLQSPHVLCLSSSGPVRRAQAIVLAGLGGGILSDQG
jgi:hypothetical protein